MTSTESGKVSQNCSCSSLFGHLVIAHSAYEKVTIQRATHTAFSDAIETGDVQSVRSLIQQHPRLVNHPNWTPPPLHCAVLWDQPTIAAILLDNGADIEIRDPDRDTTPIEYAVVYCRKDLIPVLLARGAKTDFTDEGGKTLLQLAINAAAGSFDQYDDLPDRNAYNEIVDQLKLLGVE